MFRHPDGIVAIAVVDGQYHFGTNSGSRAYTNKDKAAAEAMRDRVTRYDPELKMRAELGQMPADAFFHAETTALLRAAKENGNTLAGRTVEVYVDDKICNHCPAILPKVALELGDPTVTVMDRFGRKFTVRDGISLQRR